MIILFLPLSPFLCQLMPSFTLLSSLELTLLLFLYGGLFIPFLFPDLVEWRRAKIQYESFICFTALYAPPNILESECNTQQLALMEGLCIPKPAVLLALADKLENLRAASPKPQVSNPESQEGHGTKDETPQEGQAGGHRRHSKEASQVL